MGERSVDTETRERIRAWTIHLIKSRHYDSAADFAQELGYKQGNQVTNIINRTRTAGLDYVLRLHRVFHVELDTLVNRYPPKWKPTEDYRLS